MTSARITALHKESMDWVAGWWNTIEVFDIESGDHWTLPVPGEETKPNDFEITNIQEMEP